MSIEFNLPYPYSDEIQFMNTLFPVTDFVYTSPVIGTPYLESSQLLSPFAEQIGESSPYSVYASFANSPGRNYEQDDVYIAGYLDKKSQFPSNQETVKNFNGDQNLLIIDKSKLPAPTTTILNESKPLSPTIRLKTITEEDIDSLFPPLDSQENNAESCPEYQDQSLDQLLGYTDSPLSQAMDVDDEEEEQRQEEPNKGSEKELKQENPRKRKTSPCSTSSTNKKRNTKKTSSTKTYECPICGLESKRKYNLTTHIKTHDENRVKEFDCIQCAKSFDRRHDRDRHLATVHRQERSFGCGHCSAHFSRRDALNRHLIHKHEYVETDFEE